MHRAPDPSDRTGIEQPSWRSILAGYVLIAGLLASLWAVSNPAAALTLLLAGVAVRRGTPRAAAAVRCVRVCREFTVDLGGRLRITVAKPPVDDAA
ncbi:hypothetical protein [Halobaculum magnesiiphilum]|uniref:Uncharacterized protein n=1 Tax=Halobaculum magnesiiphilum TaxID=1017351 RepID=A0A8T8W965_9EURY|nr:hypothetical protein [Halobaculum magnesiiphilum]QZP36356.1 hypothetical protein K6T50_08390 [Halobaculum magnesiiphilum]